MPDTNKPPTLVAIGEGNVNKPTNTPDTGYTLEKMQKIKADTPDTDVGGVVIDNSPRGRLISLFGAMNLDVAKPWVDEAIAEATSSRDTYWKERVEEIYGHFSWCQECAEGPMCKDALAIKDNLK